MRNLHSAHMTKFAFKYITIKNYGFMGPSEGFGLGFGFFPGIKEPGCIEAWQQLRIESNGGHKCHCQSLSGVTSPIKKFCQVKLPKIANCLD